MSKALILLENVYICNHIINICIYRIQHKQFLLIYIYILINKIDFNKFSKYYALQV